MRRLPLTLLLLVAGLAGVLLLALLIGPYDLSWRDALRALLAEAHLSDGGGIGERERVVVAYIRLPRVLCGMCVGAALALSGVLLQGLFRNPMASPGLIGVSAGGALAASAAIALGWGALTIWAVPTAAFLGALACAWIVYAIASRGGRTPLATLILCGLAVNSMTGALTSLVLTLSASRWEVARQILFWTLGGLNDRGWEHVAMIAPFLVFAGLGAAFFPRELNIMMTGEEAAASLGVEVAAARRWVLVLSAAAAGSAVAVAGVVGFVGLIVPHMARLLVGPDHRALLPVSALGGALFLAAMDLLARTCAGGEEISLGILTSGLGGPFFLYLVLKHRRRAELF